MAKLCLRRVEWTNKYATGDATIDEQHQEHFVFVRKMMALTRKGGGNVQLTDETVDFIGGWLLNHIIGRDRVDYDAIKEKLP